MIVQILNPQSQKYQHVGIVITKEGDEVIVNFGDPVINFRFKKEEITDMEQDGKIVGSLLCNKVTVEELNLLQRRGIIAEKKSGQDLLVLRRETQQVED